MVLHLRVQKTEIAKAVFPSKQRIIQNQAGSRFVSLPTDVAKCPLEVREERNSREKLFGHVITFATESFVQVGNLTAATDKGTRVSVFTTEKRRATIRPNDRRGRTGWFHHVNSITRPALEHYSQAMHRPGQSRPVR